MAQSSLTIGRVTADLELKMSQYRNPYVRFSIAEEIGFGESGVVQFPQVWARGETATGLMGGKVKKGSLIWVSGPIMLEEFTKQDGTPDKRLKITLENWGYVPGGRQKTEPAPHAIMSRKQMLRRKLARRKLTETDRNCRNNYPFSARRGTDCVLSEGF